MDNIPYTNNDNQSQILTTLEIFGWLMFINIIWRRIRNSHIISGIILIVSIVAGFLFLINDNYGDNSFCVWSFWICVGIGVVSLGKVLS